MPILMLTLNRNMIGTLMMNATTTKNMKAASDTIAITTRALKMKMAIQRTKNRNNKKSSSLLSLSSLNLKKIQKNQLWKMLPITQPSKGKCPIKRSPKKNNSPIKKYRNFLNSLLHKAKPLSRLTRIFLSKLNPAKSSQIFNCLSKIIKAFQNCNRLKLCRLFSQISKSS